MAPSAPPRTTKAHVSAAVQFAKTGTNTKSVAAPEIHTSQGSASIQKQKPQPMGNQTSMPLVETLDSVSIDIRPASTTKSTDQTKAKSTKSEKKARKERARLERLEENGSMKPHIIIDDDLTIEQPPKKRRKKGTKTNKDPNPKDTSFDQGEYDNSLLRPAQPKELMSSTPTAMGKSTKASSPSAGRLFLQPGDPTPDGGEAEGRAEHVISQIRANKQRLTFEDLRGSEEEHPPQSVNRKERTIVLKELAESLFALDPVVVKPSSDKPKGTPKSIQSMGTKKLTPRSATRGKRKAASSMTEPPRMKQLIDKKFEGPDGEFSWSVESSPASSPAPESRKRKPTPPGPSSVATIVRGRRHPQKVQKVDNSVSSTGGRLKEPGQAPPTKSRMERNQNLKDETTSSKTPPKTQSQIPQDAVYINLDTDEEMDALVISQGRIAEPNAFQSTNLIGESKSIQKIDEDPNHHIRKENDEANDEHYLGDGQACVSGSKPQMADYRSFRPALAKSRMAERYRHLGEEKVYDEISIDWPSNTRVIDELLNQEMDFDPKYQAWWDAIILPDLQRESRDAKRNYFGSDYLSQILDLDLPTDRMDKEIKRLEITCFALFQEAGSYIVEETYKTRGFPYEGAVRGILDTYLSSAKQSMTRLQKLLFLFDKICFVDEETSGSDKISFMDWYVSRKPAYFSGYKGVLSDTAIYDLVELHDEIMRRWEDGGEPSYFPSATNPAQPTSVHPHDPTTQQPSSLILEPPIVSTIAPAVQPLSFTPPGVERASARKTSQIESQRRAAASESTVKAALEESLNPAQKTSARSAIKKKYNLLASLTSEANHIRESKMIPRFQPENILKAQATQLSLIEKRLTTLDQKRCDTMRDFVELTTRINEELKATADLTIKFQTTTQQAEEALRTALPTLSKSEELRCRKQFTAGDDLIRSEFIDLTKRRKSLMAELTQKESACMADFERIDSERKTLYDQLDRITGEKATGAGVSVPEQFLRFAEELRQWGYGKDQKLSITRVASEEETQFDHDGNFTPMDQDEETPKTAIFGGDDDVEMEDMESDELESGPVKKKRPPKMRRVGPEVVKKVTRAEMRKTRSGLEEIEASRDNTSDEEEGWVE